MKFVRGQYLNTALRAENERLRSRIAELEARAEKTEKAEAALAGATASNRALVEQLRVEYEDRDRLLSVIREAERMAMKGVLDINDGTWISDVALLLRAAVEEG